MALFPCPSCERHVKDGETTCPFCRIELASTASVLGTSDGRTSASSRAVLLFGAGVLALGCGPRAQATIYGGPPPPPATATAPEPPAPSATATVPVATAPVAIYGAPAPSDRAPQVDPKKR